MFTITLLTQLLLKTYSVDCENLEIEFPKGIENPANGYNLWLSNIAHDD